MKNKKYRIQKDLVFLTSSLFIIVCLWIALSVYDAFVTSTINETLQTQIVPINGKFDVLTIEKIRNRMNIVPDYSLPQSSVSALIITPSPIQTATQAAQPSITSGQISIPAIIEP
jgi:hypothetical protein